MATPWLRRRLAQDPTMIPAAVLDALLHQRLEREQLIHNDFTGQYLYTYLSPSLHRELYVNTSEYWCMSETM
jgi:hypothetical protein